MTSYSNYNKFMHNKQHSLQQTMHAFISKDTTKISFTIGKQRA